MLRKRILCPERLRRVPKGFSWVDHRLVGNRHICGLSHGALTLYLFLVTVGDADGLSYYSDASVGRLLSMDAATLAASRRGLCRAGLVAYSRPLYQVLSLEKSGPALCESPVVSLHRDNGEPVALGQVLRKVLGGAS